MDRAVEAQVLAAWLGRVSRNSSNELVGICPHGSSYSVSAVSWCRLPATCTLQPACCALLGLLFFFVGCTPFLRMQGWSRFVWTMQQGRLDELSLGPLDPVSASKVHPHDLCHLLALLQGFSSLYCRGGPTTTAVLQQQQKPMKG